MFLGVSVLKRKLEIKELGILGENVFVFAGFWW
jgi:hypothetical protein